MWRSLMLTRIVRPSPALETLLDSLHLNLSQPQRDHLLHLVDSLLVCDERKTLAALQRQFLDATDPSNWADFLRISPWSAADVRDALRRRQVAWLLELARARNLPEVLYVNLDDSLGKKDKHTAHIEPVDWFHDHNESTPSRPRYHKAFGSCNQLGGSRAAEEHPQELVGHLLEVVCPLENDDILFQVYFVHAPERPEEVPQPGPDPLQRVAMDLADAIAVVIPRELASIMVDRRV